ncbi:MAG: TetR/AcrR family transcriptional regulator [Pseudomonadota bacterium]
MGRQGRIETAEPLADRRIEILDAASRAFMRQGFAATSLDRVSDEIGSTKGAIYYYYRSKSELFFAVHRRGMELTRAAIGPSFEAQGSARDRLHGMAVAHTILIIDHLPYLRVIAQGLEMHLLERTNDSERAELADVAALREANESLYISVINDGVASGEFRPVDAKLVAKPLLGALNWTSRWYQPRRGETQAAKKQLADSIADFVVGGLEKKR